MADDLTHSVLAIRSITGVTTTVAGTTTNSTALLAANAPAAGNPGRLGATIYNDQGANNTTLYIKHGATCTPTDFTEAIPPNYTYEVPFSYAGVLTCVFSAATGTARVTENT